MSVLDLLPAVDWSELEYGSALDEVSAAVSDYVRLELPDDFDGEYLMVWFATLDGVDYTFCEVSGAYQNAGAYYAVGRVSPEVALSDLYISIGYDVNEGYVDEI